MTEPPPTAESWIVTPEDPEDLEQAKILAGLLNYLFPAGQKSEKPNE